jgi:hypothetical protein
MLASGREVNVDAIHIEPTYAGFDGVPDGELNARRFAAKAQRMGVAWGERPVHLIRPEISRHPVHSAFATHGEFLPDITYHVWLSEAGAACRELVVVWFGASEPHMSIYGLVERAIRDVDWDRLSQEFEP